MKKSKVSRFSKTVASALLVGVLGSASLASPADEPLAVPGWAEMIGELETLPGQLLARLPESMARDPRIQQEVARLVLQAFTSSAITAIGSYGDHPVFLPSIGELLNVGQPNADTLYRMARITPGGVYRLRGRHGDLAMAVIAQGGSEASAEAAGEGVGRLRTHLEISELASDEHGNFDVILSVERPEGHDGDWWQLHPATFRLMLRLVSADWAAEREPTLSIERLDIPAEKPRASAEVLEQRLRQLPQVTAMMAGMFVDHVEKLRQQGFVNSLRIMDGADIDGLLEGQFYYEGAYDLADDEALIIEARHPANCQYRSVLLTTELYQTTDWYNNHSSLNHAQAAVDSDGILRVVVSERDPGVPNWLHTAGHPRGVVQGRWTHCDAQPIPEVKKVAIEEVRAHLPAETPLVTAEQRQILVRERRAAYQQRIHW